MTDVLIESLKYFSGWSAREVPGIELGPASTLCWDAIDEIERLRNEVRHLRIDNARLRDEAFTRANVGGAR